MTSSNSQQKSFLQDFLLGGVSAVISKTAVAPIERFKVYLPARDINQTNFTPEKKYKEIIDYLVRVSKEEGISVFWRGNFTNVTRYFPTQALNFAFKDAYKKMFCVYNSKTEFWKFFCNNMAAGGAAGGTTLFVVYPLDFARTIFSFDRVKYASDRQFTGLSDCLKKIYMKDGVRGLYQGFCITVLGVVLYRAIYFGGYDTAKKVLFTEGKKANVVEKYLVAHGVTAISVLVTYPLNTVRRKLMMQSVRDEKLYKGTIDCFKKIYSKEGGKAFFKGAQSNSFRGGICASVMLVMYDELQAMMMTQKNAKI